MADHPEPANPDPKQLTFRASGDDLAVIAALEKKMGLRFPQVVRVAIRCLAEREKIPIP